MTQNYTEIDQLAEKFGGRYKLTVLIQKRLKELVKNAVGYSEDRGDKIEVASQPFQGETLPAGEGILGTVGRWAPVVLTRLLGVAFAGAMLLWVVRPLVLGLAVRGGGGGDVENAVTRLTQDNLQITQQNPERAAQLVREWLEAGTQG